MGAMQGLREVDSSPWAGPPVLLRSPARNANKRPGGALTPRGPGTEEPTFDAGETVSRSSDALEAQAAAEGAYTSPFLGLGAVGSWSARSGSPT